MHRGSGAPRLNGKRAAPRYLASGILRCGAKRHDGTVCHGPLCGQKVKSRKSPYFYTCRDCGRCSISGPLADQVLERLVFSEAPGHARPSESVHHRWRAGELQLEEKRKIITSVITRCVVRPGAKGNPTWDYSRVEPVWR
jgi:hypothetical protein